MQVCEIKKIISNTPIHKTFFFNLRIEYVPGQFVMLWIPGTDEIPMSISYKNKMCGITIENVGYSTSLLHSMKVGDKIGVRGPYGNGFKAVGKNALFVLGGTGAASLLPFIKIYNGEKHIALGAKTSEYLLFENELKKIGTIDISTDDGSRGYKGYVTDLAKKIIIEKSFDIVYTCGPEMMMKNIFTLCKKYNIKMQASLERYMKCGVGLCDSCAINSFHVCKDGPVFDDVKLSLINEFGQWKRNPSGKKVPV